MLARIILLFTLLPLIELALLLKIASIIDWLPTLLLVIGTGLIGAAMARAQGVLIWTRINLELSQGQLPADSMIDGLILLVGGALLITPGVLTDIVGFMTLIPPTRAMIRRYLKSRFKDSFHVSTTFHTTDFGRPEVRDTDDWENLR